MRIDTLTKQKIILQERITKGKRCVRDSYREYENVEVVYYADNKIEKLTKEKGWKNGFTGSRKVYTIYYSPTGTKMWTRKIKKKRSVVKYDIYREYDK